MSALRAAKICWACAIGRCYACTGHCDCADRGHR